MTNVPPAGLLFVTWNNRLESRVIVPEEIFERFPNMQV